MDEIVYRERIQDQKHKFENGSERAEITSLDKITIFCNIRCKRKKRGSSKTE